MRAPPYVPPPGPLTLLGCREPEGIADIDPIQLEITHFSTPGTGGKAFRPNCLLLLGGNNTARLCYKNTEDAVTVVHGYSTRT